MTDGVEVETLRLLKRSKAETSRELSGAIEPSSALLRTSASALKTPSTSGLPLFFEERLALTEEAAFLTTAFFGFSSASSGFLAAVFLVVFLFMIQGPRT
ncbi:MAG TPA: hypothetical protein DCZ01_06225 [Elusimicrobia bacterium]|nr:hypothetical protein [Elusimicrobiota bacterium]